MNTQSLTIHLPRKRDEPPLQQRDTLFIKVSDRLDISEKIERHFNSKGGAFNGDQRPAVYGVSVYDGAAGERLLSR